MLAVNRQNYIKLMHNQLMNTFGERLKYARKLRGLSQLELGRLVGIKQASISELESFGKGSTKVYFLAKVLKVNPAWLSTGKGNMEGDFEYEYISPKELTMLKIMQSLSDEQQDILIRIGNTLNESVKKTG